MSELPISVHCLFQKPFHFTKEYPKLYFSTYVEHKFLIIIILHCMSPLYDFHDIIRFCLLIITTKIRASVVCLTITIVKSLSWPRECGLASPNCSY